MSITKKISGWGRYPIIQAEISELETKSDIREYLHFSENTIPFGLGRSYGDSALNEHVFSTKRLNNFLEFDENSGILTCESGVSLAEIIEVFLPRGWFLKVTPGTKYVTVGGAIASDVHGKNHHKEGCFSESVISFNLMLPNGEVVHCNREQNRELFLTTCGGMGLTGIILKATIQLKQVQSAYINQRIYRANNLKEIFALFEENKEVTYSVAWIDCLAKGNRLGRSVLMLGEHTQDEDFKPTKPPKLGIPITLPEIFLNKYSVKLFNNLYYNKARFTKSESMVHLDKFFYPLDSINNWNRMYGKSGFTQYQFVLPKETSYDGLSEILQVIAEHEEGSFLAVLKLFGDENSNYLSFPMEGYTLALDFKMHDNLESLFAVLDDIVLEAGGRFYLTKDVRITEKKFKSGYPQLEQFNQVREKYNMNSTFESLQSQRVGL